jgi:hypothetical protein
VIPNRSIDSPLNSSIRFSTALFLKEGKREKVENFPTTLFPTALFLLANGSISLNRYIPQQLLDEKRELRDLELVRSERAGGGKEYATPRRRESTATGVNGPLRPCFA